MQGNSIDALREIALSDIQATIVDYNGDFSSPSEIITLTKDNKNLLAYKILHLPERYSTLLYMKYYFLMDNDTISGITGDQYVAGSLCYINELLCFAMGFSEDVLIAESSLKAACKLALNRASRNALQHKSDAEPDYSNRFHKALDMIPAARKTVNLFLIVAKRIAIFALVALLSFGTTLVVNADIRERFFNWVRHTFEQFSEFGVQDGTHDISDYDLEQFKKYAPQYIPSEFELWNEPFITDTVVIYDYIIETGEDKTIEFMVRTPTPDLSAYDTENVVVEEITYKNAPAFYWEKNGMAFLIWQQEGYSFSLMGNISKNEMFLMADSVGIVE